MARIVKFMGEEFWRGTIYCPAGDHLYECEIPLYIAIKHVGRHTDCDAHGGRWYEKTAKNFKSLVHFNLDENGNLIVAMEYHGS